MKTLPSSLSHTERSDGDKENKQTKTRRRHPHPPMIKAKEIFCKGHHSLFTEVVKHYERETKNLKPVVKKNRL